MKKISHFIVLLVSLFCSVFVHAQDAGEKSLGNTMRSNGRIYVVITVILVIFAILILYLVRLDRKIRKIEKTS